MNHDEAEPQFAELDAQIRAALQADAPADQLRRLEQFWQQHSRADRRRRTVRRVAALAAVLLVALAASWMLGHRSASVPRQLDLVTHQPSNSAPHDNVAQHESVDVLHPADELSVSRGRPATAYEQLVFNVRLRQREHLKQSPVVDAVEHAIECVVRDPKTDIQLLLQSPEMKSVYVEPLLLRHLRRCNDEHKRATLQLLAVCGTAQSTAALLQLSQSVVHREQALQTLEQLVRTEGLAYAATRTDDPSVRGAIYRRLWGDVDAVDICLTLVGNDMLRDEVLAAVDEVAPPVLDALLARLDAEDADVRLAAALVLGHANGPAISESLIGRVSEKPTCHTETWIALMACRGPQIDQFLAFATGQPRLLGSLNRARVYWARIMN